MGPHNPSLPSPRAQESGQRRLSRDLEVGFRDDSDEEDTDERLVSRDER